MERTPLSMNTCPACGSADLLTEAAADAEGQPTGRLLVTCALCARELGELPPPTPSPEAEPEPAEATSEEGVEEPKIRL